MKFSYLGVCVHLPILLCDDNRHSLFITPLSFLIMSGCLKLLPPEELELLEIPDPGDSLTSLKELVYATETNGASKEGKFNLSMVYLEGSRFNLFTGNQSLEQRDQEFKVIVLSLN